MSVALKFRSLVYKIGGLGQVGDFAYHVIKYESAKFLGRIWSEEHYAKWFYHLYTGKTLNLNNPQRFDEKLWWLKLNNHDPQMTICSDKYAVREYVRQCGFEDTLMEQMEVLSTVKELDVKKFGFEVVAKCTHNSGGHLFYNPDKPISDNQIRVAKRNLSFILHQNASVLSREWNYKNIPPRIVVERVVRDKNGCLPSDYKFMCFDGEPKLLFLDLGVINDDDTYNHNYPRNIYDMEFNLLPVYETRPNADYPVEKPANFDYMVKIARILSSPFPFCRVDLYNVDGKVFFGEITFYHGGGCNDIQPEEWDYRMGSWIDLNSEKIVKK